MPATLVSHHEASHHEVSRQDTVAADAVFATSVVSNPALPVICQVVDAQAYPAFMQHTDLSPLWPRIYEAFAETQLVLLDARSGEHLAHGNMVPLAWDDSRDPLPQSAAAMVQQALTHTDNGAKVTAYGALQVVVSPTAQRRGLSVRMLGQMAVCAAARGATSLCAPIRPTQKARYPLTPLEQYATWTRADGLPLDPWQREHVRLGAVPAGIVAAWLTTSAPIAHWEAWTDLRFPETGRYVVPGALDPVQMDVAAGTGRYVEPHLWMHYRIG